MDTEIGEAADTRAVVIMVGVDGTDTSLRAAAYAAGLAARQNADLVAVHIMHTPALSSGLTPQDALIAAGLQQCQTELDDQLRDRLTTDAATTGTHLTFRSAHGDPYTELVRLAEQIHPDLLVVGASAHRGHRLIGSLAVRLVRLGRWPVTVVP